MGQPPSSSLSSSSSSSSSSPLLPLFFFLFFFLFFLHSSPFWTCLEWVRTRHWQNFNHNRLDSCSSDHVSKSKPRSAWSHSSLLFILTKSIGHNGPMLHVVMLSDLLLHDSCSLISPCYAFESLSETHNTTNIHTLDVDTWQTHERGMTWKYSLVIAGLRD